MDIPFGVKMVDGDIMDGEEVISFYGEKYIFDPDVYVEGSAYTRFFGDEPEDFDVLLLRYTPTKLKLIGVPDHTITPMEIYLTDILLDWGLPIKKLKLLPALLRIKGEG